MQIILREVESITEYYDHITLKLTCGHYAVDKVKNKSWAIGQKLSCKDCLSEFKRLEFVVTSIDESEE